MNEDFYPFEPRDFSRGRFRALDFMALLDSMVQGTSLTSRTASSRISNAGNGIQDLLGNLMGAGQNIKNKVGGDNLAATGVGALIGALTGSSNSTTVNTLGGGMMGLLGMMAYKALKNSIGSSSGAAYREANRRT